LRKSISSGGNHEYRQTKQGPTEYIRTTKFICPIGCIRTTCYTLCNTVTPNDYLVRGFTSTNFSGTKDSITGKNSRIDPPHAVCQRCQSQIIGFLPRRQFQSVTDTDTAPAGHSDAPLQPTNAPYDASRGGYRAAHTPRPPHTPASTHRVLQAYPLPASYPPGGSGCTRQRSTRGVWGGALCRAHRALAALSSTQTCPPSRLQQATARCGGARATGDGR